MPSERWQEDILTPCFYTTLAGNEGTAKPQQPVLNNQFPLLHKLRTQLSRFLLCQGPKAQPGTCSPTPWVPPSHPHPHLRAHRELSTIPPRLLQLEISYNIATGKKTLNCNENSSEFCSFCFPLLLQRVSFPCFGEGAQGKAWKWYINHENIPTHAPRPQTFCFLTYRSFMLKRQNRGAWSKTLAKRSNCKAQFLWQGPFQIPIHLPRKASLASRIQQVIL